MVSSWSWKDTFEMIKSTIVSSCIVTENFVQCNLRAVVMKKKENSAAPPHSDGQRDRMLVPDFAGKGVNFHAQ